MSRNYLRAVYKIAQKQNPELVKKLWQQDTSYDSVANTGWYDGIRNVLYSLAVTDPRAFTYAVSRVSGN
jgi:hypothetical protein